VRTRFASETSFSPICASLSLKVLVCSGRLGEVKRWQSQRHLWGYIDRRDHRLMRRMNRWRAPRWFRIWMIVATRMGDGWIWYGLGLMLLALWRPSALFGHRCCGVGSGSGYSCFHSAEETEPAAEALPDRASLLGRKCCLRIGFRFHRVTP